MNENIPDANETAAELDRLRHENEELRLAVRLRDARDVMTAKIAREGGRSPELLFDAVRGDLQFDESGQPVNAAALIADIRKRFPEQFEQVHAAASIDAGKGSANLAPPLTADSLARMTPAEIQRLDWAEVRSALANQ